MLKWDCYLKDGVIPKPYAPYSGKPGRNKFVGNDLLKS